MEEKEAILDNLFKEVLGIYDDSAMLDEMKPGDTDNWDSLNNMQLISAIEDTFNIEFDFDELIGYDNWGELKALVLKKIGV